MTASELKGATVKISGDPYLVEELLDEILEVVESVHVSRIVQRSDGGSHVYISVTGVKKV